MGSTQSTWAIIFILCLIYSCTCGGLQTKVALEVDAQKTNEIEEMTENEHEDSEENMKMGLEESEEIEEETPCQGKGKGKCPTTSKKTEEKPKKKFAQDVEKHIDVIHLNQKRRNLLKKNSQEVLEKERETLKKEKGKSKK